MYLVDLTENELATYLVVRLRNVDSNRAMSKWQTANGNGLQSAICNLPFAVLAYGGFWLMVDEAHIATIASHPDWRGCGLGQYLLVALLEAARDRGARLATLEVRAGNRPAQQLYRKLGFEIVGFRPHYYRDGEDGLIMTAPPLAGPAMRERLATVRAEAAAKLERCFYHVRLP
jgi:ribosomal-protein-alanine acetyltransferase